jgi:hypothetical protein
MKCKQNNKIMLEDERDSLLDVWHCGMEEDLIRDGEIHLARKSGIRFVK